MLKDELLSLLRDPEVCHEIFSIVRRGGLPAPIQDLTQTKIPPPTASTVKVEPAVSTPQVTTSPEREKILALREKMWKAMVERKNRAAAKNPADEPEDTNLQEDAEKIVESPEEEKETSFQKKLQLLRNHAQKVREERQQAEAAAQENSEAAAVEKYTFVSKRPCPICEEKTRIVYCKTRLITEKQDLDLCVHYKDFNPYLYNVWSCEHCGYAAEEHKFRSYFPERTKERIRAFLQTNDMIIPFVEERSVQDALSYYEMAVLFSELFDRSPGRQAILYQRMSWICRIENETEQEHEYMKKAAELYELSLNTERYPIGKLSDDTAMYLTGALYFMLEDYDKATKQLSHIMSNQSLRTSAPKMFEKARDIWQEIKQIRKREQANEERLQAVIKRANS